MNVWISENWNEYLNRFSEEQLDIYYTEEYVKLYENSEDKALCIICESEGKITLMPFLRRNIGEQYDFETPYGYGGPIFNELSRTWIEKSLCSIIDHFKSEGYVCGFLRFHPIIKNAVLCKDISCVLYDRKTIRIDLEDSVEDIWSDQIISKNRNMIRKAEKCGLTYRAEYDFRSMESFIKLYTDTMSRLQADSFYFFDRKYYDGLVKGLNGHGFLGIVSYEGKDIAAAIFMTYGKYGHYHLAGNDREYSSLGANNYLLWRTSLELKEHEFKLLHLGGGNSSDASDPLYKFKRSFSDRENDFYIGKWILDESLYDRICSKWEKENPDLVPVYGNRLLKYRYE